MESDLHTALKAAFTALLVFALNVPCHAQSTLTERSFGDLSDTSDASRDNAAVAERGGLPSDLAPLHCFQALNPAGDSTAITLSVQKGSYGIYNPDTDSFDIVSLRSYNGCPFGPTISIKPGATLKIALKNKLTVNDPPDFCPNTVSFTTPHCFNHTNLHMHGLHVSPAGTSDNVLLTVLPGATQACTFNIPSTHPSGTFLYPPHHHGSTAIQL